MAKEFQSEVEEGTISVVGSITQLCRTQPRVLFFANLGVYLIGEDLYPILKRCRQYQRYINLALVGK